MRIDRVKADNTGRDEKAKANAGSRSARSSVSAAYTWCATLKFIFSTILFSFPRVECVVVLYSSVKEREKHRETRFLLLEVIL